MTEDVNLDAPIITGDYTFSQPIITYQDDGTMVITASVTHAFPHHGDPRTLSNGSVWVGGQIVVWGGHNIHIDYTDTYRLDFTFTIPRWEITAFGGPIEVSVGFGAWVTPPGQVIFIRQLSTLPTKKLLAFLPNVIIRSLFQSGFHGPDFPTPDWVAAYKAAGFNAIEIGAFKNPADGGTPNMSYTEWDAARDYFIQPAVNFCVDHDLYIIAIGDDFMATNQERTWLANSPIGGAVTCRTAEMFRDSGKCVCIETVDEATEKGDLHLHPAAQLFTSVWRSTPGAPPIGWPSAYTLGPPDPTPRTPFEENGMAAYSSRYHRPAEMGRANGNTLPGIFKAKRNSVNNTIGGAPLLLLVGAMGPYYWKQVAGGDYQEGDRLVNIGSRPMDIRTEIWLNMIYGGAGYRVYSYDRPAMVADRLNAPADGTALLQTGTKPGDERWAMLTEINAQVQELTPHLLEGVRGVEYRGHLVIGRWPAMMVTVNTSESPIEGIEPGGVVIEVA